MEKLLAAKNQQDFRNYLLEQEKSKATIEKYLRDVSKLYFYAGEKQVPEKADILAFKESLVKQYKPASVNSIIAAVNSFFDFCGCPELKMKRIRMQRPVFCSPEKELTKAEYKRLLAAAKKQCDQRLYYIMMTICSTGIRISELSYITVESLYECQAAVRSKNKLRTILIPESLKRQLLRYVKQQQIKSGPVFITRGKQAVDRSSVWRGMKNLAKAAGVNRVKVYPHNLRHLFARSFYRQKNDIVMLADILGHSSIDTTRIYTMTTIRRHALEIEQLGLII